MPKFLLSILLVTCMAPFHFGCGEEAPIHEADTSSQDIDPAEEAANDKEMKKNN